MSKILIFLIVGILIANSKGEEVKSRKKRSTYDTFLLAHTIDPADPRTSDYERWTSSDWDYWLRRREPLHDQANGYRGTPLSGKGYNTVIVATDRGIQRAFEGRLIPYDYDGIYWSNRSFQTYVLRRNGRYLDVYECGHLYIAARLVRGLPVSFYTAFPEETYHQFKGELHYNLYKHCYRIRDPSHSSNNNIYYYPASREGTSYYHPRRPSSSYVNYYTYGRGH